MAIKSLLLSIDIMSSTRHFFSRRFAAQLSGQSTLSMASRELTLNGQNRRFAAATTTTTSNNVDTLIIGGGPIGLSTAYHLATNYRDNDGKGIAIVERDPTYAHSSAMLSAGGIRQQVSTAVDLCCFVYPKKVTTRATTVKTTAIARTCVSLIYFIRASVVS